MQRMLDDLLAKRVVYENAKMYECVATLETSIEIAQYLLEKEKEQIIEAFESGMAEGDGIHSANLDYDANSSIYFNQTYNQNK